MLACPGCISLKVICNSCFTLQVPVDHHCVQYHIYSGSLCLVAILSGGARPAGPLQPSPQVCAGQVCHLHDLLAGELCCIAHIFHAVLCMSARQAEIMLWTTDKHTHPCCQHHDLKQKKLVWLCIGTQLNVGTTQGRAADGLGLALCTHCNNGVCFFMLSMPL